MEKKKKHSNLINILMIALFSFLVVFLVIKDDFNGVLNTLKNAEWTFVVLALGLFSFRYLIDGMILLILTRKYKKDYTYKEACLNGMVGSFFSSITPSSTGGQFSQMYVYDKQGVSYEKSGSLMIMTFISYEVILVLYCLFTIIFAKGNVSPTVTLFGLNINFFVLVIIGFIINAGGVGLLLFAAYSNKVLNLIHKFIRGLNKIKIIKDPNKTIENFDNKIILIRNEIKDIKGNYKYFLISAILYIVRSTISFSTPFLVGLALHIPLQPHHLFISIILSSYLTLINSFVPIPGASGGAEFFFALFFTSYFGSQTMMASALLIWRFVTFYFGLIIGLFVTINFNHKLSVNIFKEVNDDYRWFVLSKKDVVKENIVKE